MKGTVSIYYSLTEDAAVVQLLELDGTNQVNEYCEQLARQLPERYIIGHNSPTDGTLYIVALETNESNFDRYFFLDLFKDLFKQSLFGTVIGYPQYKVVLAYAQSYYERTELSIDDFLNQLNPDDEILDQLIRLDFNMSKSCLGNSLLHWKMFKDSWYIDLPNGLTLCANNIWIYLSDISVDHESFGQLGHCVWVTGFERLEPEPENNLYHELVKHIDKDLADKCSADLMIIYNS